MENKMALVMCIVNSGYSEKVMEIVKSNGAKGGTILNAFGSASLDAEKIFGITVNPEKEVVMILIPDLISKTILKALYESIGPNTEAQGIAFTLPVTDTTSNLVSQYKEKKVQIK